MFDDLDPSVQETMIGILVAIYESNMVKSVDLGLLLKLFGYQLEENQPNMTVDFSQEWWLQTYEDYKEFIASVLNSGDVGYSNADLGSDRTLH